MTSTELEISTPRRPLAIGKGLPVQPRLHMLRVPATEAGVGGDDMSGVAAQRYAWRTI